MIVRVAVRLVSPLITDAGLCERMNEFWLILR